jgi:RNA polymerase sigma-70 factor, ECF subfamily
MAGIQRGRVIQSGTGRVKYGMASAVSLQPDLDAALMLRVRDGDEASFKTLLERHRRPLIHYLTRLVQNQAIAEELAQESFLRVFRSRASYEPSAKFSTWLFRIGTNLAFNWLRDQKGSRRDGQAQDAASSVSNGQPSVESVLVREVKLKEIREAVARLPGKQRAAVLLHKYDEMEYSQIARELGCSESAVKSLLFRAYESLRARLTQYAG